MSDLDLEALRAIKFTSDQSDNGDLEKAVTLNHYALSKLFGYVLESDVPIVSMAVSGSDPTVIMKGKYKSALWVWYWFCLHGAACSIAADGYSINITFKMTETAIASAKQYFGESICEDASSGDTVHGFVRDILYSGEVQVCFEFSIKS